MSALIPLPMRQAINEGELKRLILARAEQAHRMVADGRGWKCVCDGWHGETPKVGPFGRTTMKARIAQVRMAHGKHARPAVAKAVRA